MCGASAITDQVASMTFTESQVNPSKPVSALIAAPREMHEAYNDTLTTVDEVTKPTQSQNRCEYDYIQ